MDKNILIKRLSIVKLLFKRSLELSRQSESTAFLSILGFHDAVDIYLNIAAQHLNLKPEKGKSFLKDYLSLVPNLKHIQSMLKLNENRNNIKHSGVTLHSLEVESARVHTTEFFNDNTKNIFDIEFNDISLIELVSFESAKNLLLKAQQKLNQNDIQNSLLLSTVAFDELISEYKKNKYSHRSPAGFEFAKSVGNTMVLRLQGNVDRNFENLVENLNDNFETINKALEILALGIDYRKYAKFRAIAPIRYYYDKTKGEVLMTSYKEKKWIKENCDFVMDFVIESALILQEINFDYMDLQNIGRDNGVSTL